VGALSPRDLAPGVGKLGNAIAISEHALVARVHILRAGPAGLHHRFVVRRLAAALALGAVWALAQVVANARPSAIVETVSRFFIVEPP
jgi:hypothetical protein